MTVLLSRPAAVEPDVRRFTERVELTLEGFLGARAAELAEAGLELSDLSRLAHVAVLGGGKRLRPCFAYWGWRAASTEPLTDDGLVAVAASIELLHACALVQDDVMDDAAIRRGRPAAHHVLAAMHRSRRWFGDADAFGRAAATLLGDLLLAWAESLFAEARLPTPRLTAARRVYEQMRQLVMAGQYLDMLLQARGGFDVGDALHVATLKTGKYTVEGPLHLGAAAAGASRQTIAALSGYAIPLGEAFQLRDDVLGVFGESRVTGKPVGQDLRDGKRTLLVVLAMQAATNAQAALLRRRLGKRDLDERGIADLRDIIVESGALAQVEERISEQCAAARAALLLAPVSVEAREALNGLAERVTCRDS